MRQSPELQSTFFVSSGQGLLLEDQFSFYQQDIIININKGSGIIHLDENKLYTKMPAEFLAFISE